LGDSTKVCPGDIIFSVVRNNIVAIAMATSRAYEAIMPGEFSQHGWDRNGWRVDAEYERVQYPIKVADIIEELIPYMSAGGAPFQHNGRGNQGYLYELDDTAGRIILDKLSNKNDIVTRLVSESKISLDDFTTAFDLLEKSGILGSEGITLSKYRIGHSIYRKALLKSYNRCQICGINLKEILVASHIKPWRAADPSERVDYNNGLLLCPTHDKLFDLGLITFDDDGRIIIANRINGTQYNVINIKDTTLIDMNSNRRSYMVWHRNNVFNDTES